MGNERLKKQLTEAAGNVIYTYVAHWNIVNRLKIRFKIIKITQIVLTAISTGGFLTSIIAGIPCLSWLGGFSSALALFLNLYMLNFNITDDIKRHEEAANELWNIREGYRSLIVDFDDLSQEIIREKRDKLIAETSRVNKEYPGTDERSFTKAKKTIGNYSFDEGEAEKLL